MEVFWGALLLGVYLIAPLVQSECESPPGSESGEDFVSCCHATEINELAFGAECGHFDIRQLYKQESACHHACVFNASGAMKGSHFKLRKVYSMVKNLFPTDGLYAKALIKGFQVCIPLLPDMEREIKKKTASTTVEPQDENATAAACNPVALRMSECALAYALVFCPAERFTSNKSCDDMRNYYISC